MKQNHIYTAEQIEEMQDKGYLAIWLAIGYFAVLGLLYIIK